MRNDLLISRNGATVGALMLLLCLAMATPAPARNQVTAIARPQTANPAVATELEVAIHIDLTGAEQAERLGSFSGSLSWDPSVLGYKFGSGLLRDFSGVVNTDQADAGRIIFSAANPNGVADSVLVMVLTFQTIGQPGDSTALDLDFTAMAAAQTFTNLLPILTILPSHVILQQAPDPEPVAHFFGCPDSARTGQRFEFQLLVDMRDVPAPDENLGRFAGSLRWDPDALQYVASRRTSEFEGVIDSDSVSFGVLRFDGANPNGITGNVPLLEVSLRIVGEAGLQTELTPVFSALAAARTLRDLLPFLRIEACQIDIFDRIACDPQACAASAVIFPTAPGASELVPVSGSEGDTVAIDLRVRRIPSFIRSFGVTLQVDPSQLTFLRAERGDLTQGFEFIDAAELTPNSGTIVCGGIWLADFIAPLSSGVLMRLYFRVSGAHDSSEILLTDLTDHVAEFEPCCNRFLLLGCNNDGDVNGDGVLTPGDALCAFQIYLGGQRPPTDAACNNPGSDCEVVAADVNCDNQVTPGDALAIFLRYLARGEPATCFARSMALAAHAQAPPVLTITRRILPTDATQPDQRLQVSLRVPPNSGITAFGVQLAYHGEAWEFLGIERGASTADWQQLSGNVIGNGELRIGGFHTAPLASSEPGELVRLRFRLRQPGSLEAPVQVLALTDDLALADVVIDAGEAASGGIPDDFALQQNFPNPFRVDVDGGGTTIRFEIPGTESVSVQLAVYSITGRLIRRLVSGERNGGVFDMRWDGRDAEGRPVPSGTYLYRLQAGSRTLTKSLTIIR